MVLGFRVGFRVGFRDYGLGLRVLEFRVRQTGTPNKGGQSPKPKTLENPHLGLSTVGVGEFRA